MVSRSWPLLVLLASCARAPEELQLIGPSRIADDGRFARITVNVATADGQPGSGVVSLNTSAGEFSSPTVQLEAGGNGSVEFSCSRATDPRCSGAVTLSARWNSLEVERVVQVVPPASLLPFDAGHIERDDAGFDCVADYDGGPRPGYTQPDGGPLAIGCHGEPIDAVFLDSSSPTRISICGTVTLAVPRTRPTYPRISLQGEFFYKNLVSDCCYELQCLRNPNQITYRFDIEPAGWTTLGVGARSFDRSYSMFGYYGGTPAKPLTDGPTSKRVLLDGGSLEGVDFFVGPGKRPGDP